MALLANIPQQSSEMQKQEIVHQRDMVLDMLSEIANVFDFPDLNHFLSVSDNLRFIEFLYLFILGKK